MWIEMRGMGGWAQTARRSKYHAVLLLMSIVLILPGCRKYNRSDASPVAKNVSGHIRFSVEYQKLDSSWSPQDADVQQHWRQIMVPLLEETFGRIRAVADEPDVIVQYGNALMDSSEEGVLTISAAVVVGGASKNGIARIVSLFDEMGTLVCDAELTEWLAAQERRWQIDKRGPKVTVTGIKCTPSVSGMARLHVTFELAGPWRSGGQIDTHYRGEVRRGRFTDGGEIRSVVNIVAQYDVSAVSGTGVCELSEDAREISAASSLILMLFVQEEGGKIRILRSLPVTIGACP